MGDARPRLYAFAATHATLATLESMGLPDPFPATFDPYAVRYEDGKGQPQGDGFASAEWHFDILSHEQFHLLTTFIGDHESKAVYVVTRTEQSIVHDSYAGSFKEFTGYMVKPSPADYSIEMRYFYRDVTVRLTMLVEYAD